MEVKKIDIQQTNPSIQGNTTTTQTSSTRPVWFSDFVWQDDIVSIVKTAITSAKRSSHTLWHMLFSWASGHGKTTLANIIANDMQVNIKIVTWYAISKPSELISILNNLQEWDILFIDEIHRLKPTVEEVLYIAMEDRVIDFVMPEGGSMRLPIQHFTLIGATTKMESLSAPLKNRFIYKFHFQDYNHTEILAIIRNYLKHYMIDADEASVLEISKKVERTPREIHNICVKIRDYLIANGNTHLTMRASQRPTFEQRLNIDAWGITPLHKKYLAILAEHEEPVGIKTLAAKLWIHEKAIETDIEPLLLKLGKIDKTTRGRTIK